MSEVNARAFAAFQRLLPQHGLSRAAGWLASATTPWIKNQLIRTFVSFYQVDLSTAAREQIEDYGSFNDFFTRELKLGVRPISKDDAAIVSPVDGTVSQSGKIEDGQMVQAKNWRYTASALAHELADGFDGGSFATFYLAPRDYHRVHAPSSGTLTAAKAIPGALFSVNSATEHGVEGLFCRNERLVCRLQTRCGDLLVVLVGALVVGSIATPWPSPTSPYHTSEMVNPNVQLQRGEELGRFLIGSTVILCTPPSRCRLSNLQVGSQVRMGEPIGRWLSA